ncbi:siderophore-interacting protein [Aeromicrobium wangtongii]|uniref:siderophore-interacting protein n=1 Tax=Aeromicrobium wangtongii TaxID=2969247 RepID=UPI002016F781|nr:siderophore-interacting protein [Aeromicrobium wangtongii]MCL3817330.1 siderophore-interacting protein [Aeromicrobium wangtongii]
MAATHLTVTSTEWVTPRLRRLWFHSDDLSAFTGSEHTDRYVKLVFPKPGVELPEPLDLRALRGQLPAEDMPTVRTYTALFPDVEAGTAAIDFVIHGDEGVAGRWAAAAQPGEQLLVTGPGGAYRPDPSADWHLLVGDESAIPAITAALTVLAELPDAVPVRVVALVDDAAHEPVLPLPPGAEVTWVHRSAGGGDAALEEAVRAVEWLPGRVQAFVHGEASQVMHGIRPYLLRERRLPRSQVSVSGYWRHGRTEEGFRAWKSQQPR